MDKFGDCINNIEMLWLQLNRMDCGKCKNLFGAIAKLKKPVRVGIKLSINFCKEEFCCFFSVT